MPDSGTAERDRWRFLRRHESILLIAIFLVIVLTMLLDSEHSYYHDLATNFQQIVRQTSYLGIFSLGAAIVIIAGGIDLSSGSVICFSGTICATLLLILAPDQMQSSETPIGFTVASIAICGALVVGFLIGSLHAWLISVVGLPPFIATLATLVGLRSFARAICENVTETVLQGRSTQIQIFDPRFRYLATSVWIPAVLFFGLSVVAWLLLSKTVLGRHLYALGGNEEAARLSGVRVDRMKWFAYCASAIFSSIAGVLYICEQSVATPLVLGRGYELNAIAAAVVGGCSLQGGVGTVPGTVLGAFFLRIVTDGVAKIIHTGADVYEGLIVGVVVVFAAAFSQTKAVRRTASFFAGGLGLVAAINVALLAGAVAVSVGPTLLDVMRNLVAVAFGDSAAALVKGMTNLTPPWLGLWTAFAVFAFLLVLRGGVRERPRQVLAIGLAIAVVALYAALDWGMPAYRLSAARSAVQSLGGTLSLIPGEGWRVDLSSTDLDDQSLKALIDRLSSVPDVVELSLARTKVTDKGIASIKGLSMLKRLNLAGTNVSPGARTGLGRALPDVTIVE